jgi:hypothetical protein
MGERVVIEYESRGEENGRRDGEQDIEILPAGDGHSQAGGVPVVWRRAGARQDRTPKAVLLG